MAAAGITAPAGLPVTAEMVAPLANMIESALAAGPPLAPALAGRAASRAAGGDAGRVEDYPGAPGPDRDDLPAAVHADAGPRARRVHRPAIRAGRRGWPAVRIEVIDCDLGLSGRTATRREGFKRLLGQVCLGEVGAIFGLEVSRLARSSADLSRLLEVARITGTLVIDADGIYDLADINDRLLLGLKGQMSEAELHLLHSRLGGARLAAAGRGELRLPLPAGYVHDADGQVVKDPDQEVAAAVADMFAAFTATGSAY